MIDRSVPLAVVCHDAGAANIIIAWMREHSAPIRAFMAGPARNLWQAAFPGMTLHDSLEQALDGAQMLVSGTGWASSIEHEARRVASQRNIHSVAVIDHWVNYPERFTREGDVFWPDEFWVTDEDALRIACSHFPAERVRLVPNLYLRQQVDAIAPAGDAHDVLYVLEPARSDWGRQESGEFQALEYFLAHRAALGLPAGAVVRLRPHPSDPSGKYAAVLARHPDLRLDESPDIACAIGNCGWVAGMESFALVVALNAGRRVVCTLPPWAPPCRLPQRGLIHLKDLLSK